MMYFSAASALPMQGILVVRKSAARGTVALATAAPMPVWSVTPYEYAVSSPRPPSEIHSSMAAVSLGVE